MKWYIYALKQSFNINKGASQKELWNFLYYHLLFTTLSLFISITLRAFFNRLDIYTNICFILFISYSVLLLPASITVIIRRLRDVGRNWKLLFLYFLPVIGHFILIYILARKSDLQTQNEDVNMPGCLNIKSDFILTVAFIYIIGFHVFWDNFVGLLPQNLNYVSLLLDNIRGYIFFLLPVLFVRCISNIQIKNKMKIAMAIYMYCSYIWGMNQIAIIITQI